MKVWFLPNWMDTRLTTLFPSQKAGLSGPDAVVNYVLTTQKANEAKADHTPYDWFHQEMPDKWDAYVNRVRARATHLRNKKVQLLIALNAAELADKYTAL